MKVLLMHPETDFNVEATIRENSDDLIQDLELGTIITTAAGGDRLVWQAFSQALLSDDHDAATISYRQEVLADCRAAPDLIRELYQLAGDAVESERRVWPVWSRDEPRAMITNSVATLEATTEHMRRLRAIADEHAPAFESPGFRRFFATITEELGDDYLARLDDQLKELHFPFGVLISAELGASNRGLHYIARHASDPGFLAGWGYAARAMDSRSPIATRRGFKRWPRWRTEACARSVR